MALNCVQVSWRNTRLSNFLSGTFDSVRRNALHAARRALPQRCELCAGPSGTELVCTRCARELPCIGVACPVCAMPTPEAQVCGQCLAHPPAFDATVAAYAYAFPVDRLIQAFKYRGHLALAEWCAVAIIAARARRTATVPPRLIALPLSPARQRERGYNQAAEIARQIAARTHATLVTRGVRRIRATPPQAALPWPERARNVRDAFACDVDLTGLDVAVVDDVMTTGATLAEFARTLKTAGAARVENWVVARTLPP
ncbi:MAG: ComF family protein [Casimicrobiaceae bacterium]